MAQATLAGKPFRVNPLSAEWSYTVKTAETNTVGGTVVQVFGVDLGPMTVRGSFGRGGWKEQAEWLAAVKYIGAYQASNPDPIRFLFPAKGWDFLVNVMAFGEVGSMAAVNASNANFAPTWELSLFVIEDNSPIKTVQDAALLQYINRLSAGLGWQQTKYNGPITEADVTSYVTEHDATSVSDLLTQFAAGEVAP